MDSSVDVLKKANDLLIKAKRLIDRFDKLNHTLAAKDEKIISLQKENSEKQNRILKLEQEVASLKLGSLVSVSEEEKKEVRQKLNEHIKEIDKMIAKLSAEG